MQKPTRTGSPASFFFLSTTICQPSTTEFVDAVPKSAKPCGRACVSAEARRAPFGLAKSADSKRLTASSDQIVKLWSAQTGRELFTFNCGALTRSVEFSVGDRLAVVTTDSFMELSSAIHVMSIAEDIQDQVSESVLVMKGPQERTNRAVWGPLNKTIISAREDTVIHIWDTELFM